MLSFLATPLKILLSGLAAVSILFCARLAGIGPGPLLSAPGSLAAILIFLVGLAFAGFLWWLASRCFTLLRDPATTPEQMAALRELPLALPEGTVRALLALIVGVIGLPLLLFSQTLALNDAVAGYVNGIIAGVFGYYFGARTTTPEAQAARRLGDALEGQQRANEALRASEAAARDAAAQAGQPSLIAQAIEKLESHLSVARILVQRLGPALPAGVIPAQAETWLNDAEQALTAARALGGQADLGTLQAATSALTGSAGPLASLLRAAAPLLPAAAGGPLAGVAMLLGLGWNLGAAAWRRFRAQILDAPHDPALFEPGAITPASAELRLADAAIFARLFTPRLAEPGFLAGLLDTCLREDAADRLWARYPGFASPAEAAQGLAEFRRARPPPRRRAPGDAAPARSRRGPGGDAGPRSVARRAAREPHRPCPPAPGADAMRLIPLLLLAGCTSLAGAIDPPLAQLARWEHASPAAIAAEPVGCPAGHDACPRLHALRAEACMSLAMAARAPGAACPALADHLPCAAESYAAARALKPDPKLAAGEAQARLCLAELSAPGEGAQEAARAAEAATAAEGWRLLGARAALLAARPGAAPDPRRCSAAQAGLRLALPGSREAADLARRIATIPNCGAAP